MIVNSIKPSLLYCKTVLVADDENSIVALASELFTDQGYHVLSACGGKKALSLLEKETVDTLVYDVVIPDMDGCEFAELVQRYCPHIKIQLISEFPEDASEGDDNNESKRQFIHKPYTENSIVNRLRTLMGFNDNIDILANHTVLVVDDNKRDRDLFRIILEKFGCNTITAQTDEEAIEIYRQSMNSEQFIDAVVLGLHMRPKGSGKNTADKLRGMDPCVKTIVAGEHKQFPEILSYHEREKKTSMEKYYDSSAIKQMLKQVLDEKQADLALE